MRTFEIFFRHIKSLGFWPDVCIDVGAGYGTGAIYSAFPEAYHIVFEPVAENQEKLEKRLAGLPHKIYMCGLLSKHGKMRLAKMGKDHLGSTFMSKGQADETEFVEVPVNILDDYVDEVGKDKKVLLKIDCQGTDLEVLKGADKILDVVELVIVEASLFRFWGEQHPKMLDICNHMQEKGFSIYDILDPNYRPLDNALGQVDLVFAKSKGSLRQHPYWGSNELPAASNLADHGGRHDVPNNFQFILNQKDSEISHLKNLIKIREQKTADAQNNFQTILNQKNSEISHLKNLAKIREQKTVAFNRVCSKMESGSSDQEIANELKSMIKDIMKQGV